MSQFGSGLSGRHCLSQQWLSNRSRKRRLNSFFRFSLLETMADLCGLIYNKRWKAARWEFSLNWDRIKPGKREMITAEEEAFVLKKAYVPEHIASLMAGISMGDPFLIEEHLGFAKDNWLILV